MIKNELMIIDRIDKQIQKPRTETVFPLTPTHRKELRQLRDKNIGNLTSRMRVIRSLKKDEYIKKYYKEIQKELTIKEKTVKMLNDDWAIRISKINDLIIERKNLEANNDMDDVDIDSGYSDLTSLKSVSNVKRKCSIHIKNVSQHIAEKEFESKYGAKFKGVQKNIDSINEKYEEAINFGDLEIVKELYYIMKKADSFFIKISDLEI